MSRPDIESITLDALVKTMPLGLRKVLDGLLLAGYSVDDVRTYVVTMVRQKAERCFTLTELAIAEYLERVERGEVKPGSTPPSPPSSSG